MIVNCCLQYSCRSSILLFFTEFYYFSSNFTNSHSNISTFTTIAPVNISILTIPIISDAAVFYRSSSDAIRRVFFSLFSSCKRQELMRRFLDFEYRIIVVVVAIQRKSLNTYNPSTTIYIYLYITVIVQKCPLFTNTLYLM